MKKAITLALKSLAMLVAGLLLLVLSFSVSPIYDFEKPHPFEGPDIFNPYASLDSCVRWKRANFHTHTRVKGPIPPNECECWPSEVLEAYNALGYDILTFSNHNELTKHPTDPELQVNVYEHGYGLMKYHKLVFGASRVRWFDHLLPLLASQKQWQLDYLGRGSDFIQMNHPFRTGGTSQYQMSVLTGYEIMELDSGVSTEQEYWDWALSAGHYSFGLANDDNHKPHASDKIGVRANFLDVPSGRYEDLKDCLLSGPYYSMRIPDYGSGNWEEKYARNREIPAVEAIGLRDSTIFLRLSKPASLIKVSGQDRCIIDTLSNASAMECVMHHDQPYARITAYFDDGAVIYSNVFARYDKTKSPTPYRESGHSVNVALTVLYNLGLLCAIALLLWLMISLPGSFRLSEE